MRHHQASRNCRCFQSLIRTLHTSASRPSPKFESHALREKDRTVNAFVSFSDSRPSDGHHAEIKPLSNCSIALKDNICTKTLPVTCSSAMLRDFTSPFDSTVVRLLQTAGADIVGKTNCDEFGMGSFNVHSVHGPVINPYISPSSSLRWEEREQRSAGGSSGGSAAAVASGMCFAALSTDTGGSTRLPAAYCGIVGLKPSYGLISRWGVVSFADSLDCVGVMAKKVTDAATVFRILSIHDNKDPTTASYEQRSKATRSCRQKLDLMKRDSDGCLSDLQKLVIGVPQEYFPRELDESSVKPLRRILERLQASGATILPVSLPMTPYALSAYYVIASAEARSNLARYNGVHYGTRLETPPGLDRTRASNIYAHTRSINFGHEVQKRILLGTYALTADAFNNYFLQAQRVRKLIQADFDAVFGSPENASTRRVDVLLHPSAIGTAPRLADLDSASELDAYVQDVLTVPASLAGLPAMSVPAGLADDEWPVGISVVGQWGEDELVLEVGEVIERVIASP